MPVEPTEHDARDLLARAAATIDVDDAAALALTGLPEPPRRRWPLLVSVAAAVALVAGVGVVIARHGGDRPAPGPVVVPTPPPSATLAPDQIPSLLGYRQDEAVRELERRGFTVSVERTGVFCQPGDMVVGSDPAAGTHAAPGTLVKIEVTRQRTAIDCVGEPDRELGWELVRFARGLDGPPPLADHLVLHGPTDSTVTLTRAQAAHPGDWTACGNALGCEGVLQALARVVETPVPEGERFLPTSLSMGWGDVCPAGAGPDGQQMVLEVVHPVDGIFCPAVRFFIREDQQGRLAEMWVITNDVAAPPESEEPTGSRSAAARAFTEWARATGPPPDFADRVREMFAGGGAFGADPWNDNPTSRTTWSGCSGLGFPRCPLDPVATLANHVGPVAVTPGRAVTCPSGGDVPEPYAGATDDVVRIELPEPSSCKTAWAVELWVHVDGQIYAVNLAGHGA